jgi:hypothetical protein
MKYFILLSVLLSAGCNHCLQEEPDFSHSCPKAGHGPCFLCDDPLEKSHLYSKK